MQSDKRLYYLLDLLLDFITAIIITSLPFMLINTESTTAAITYGHDNDNQGDKNVLGVDLLQQSKYNNTLVTSKGVVFTWNEWLNIKQHGQHGQTIKQAVLSYIFIQSAFIRREQGTFYVNFAFVY